MPFIEPNAVAAKELLPGWIARFFHFDHRTVSYTEVAHSSQVHLHHYPEEVWHIIEGELEMVLGNETRLVKAGEAAVVPAEVEHSARASRRCRGIVDDFPVREVVGGVNIR